jgi:hypothetical protein
MVPLLIGELFPEHDYDSLSNLLPSWDDAHFERPGLSNHDHDSYNSEWNHHKCDPGSTLSRES